MKYVVTIIRRPSVFSKPYGSHNFTVQRVEFKSRRAARRLMGRLLRRMGGDGERRTVKVLFTSEER